MLRIIKVSTLVAAFLALPGCATVIHGTTQSVRVDAKTEAGESVPDAACVAFNDRGSTALKPGIAQVIPRAAADMNFVCTHPGLPPALGIATSRINPGIAGNAIIGGVVGVAVDISNGAAFSYPTWLQMVFGKARVFDRNFEKAGQPLQGFAVGSTPGSP